jgi:hypothetical protein
LKEILTIHQAAAADTRLKSAVKQEVMAKEAFELAKADQKAKAVDLDSLEAAAPQVKLDPEVEALAAAVLARSHVEVARLQHELEESARYLLCIDVASDNTRLLARSSPMLRYLRCRQQFFFIRIPCHVFFFSYVQGVSYDPFIALFHALLVSCF